MPSPPRYLSSLSFASLLVYSPQGQAETSKASRRLPRAIKGDSVWPGQSVPFIRYTVQRLASMAQDEVFSGLFGPARALVPVPRGAPLTLGALWPAKRICEELKHAGLGGTVLELLERTEAVRKAAFASSSGGARPTFADHVRTTRCASELVWHDRFLLVDDFVTSGTQLIAAASALLAMYPTASVTGFALVRTMSRVEVDQILAPCAGTISYDGGDYARRDP